ncbi:MAG: RHS repeat domain-containing protein [Vicinamibacterales bacterium]
MDVTGQSEISYVFDDGDRLTSLAQGTNVVAFGYDDANRRTSLTLPNGIVTEYGYDTASHLTSLTFKLWDTPLGDLAYSYDAAGERTSVGGSWARANLPAALSSATYDADNQTGTFGGVSFSYDPNGSLTNDGTNAYSWNARNQLASISGGASASFAYDGTGRRRSKTIAGSSTAFLYDGLNPVQELVGGSASANLLTGLGVDEYFSRDDGSPAFFANDALGSTVALSDGTGTVQTNYAYDPFGATTFSGATSANASQFAGRENDGAGLYFYRARFYNPALQRFLSEDPLGTAGGLNLFAFAENAPTVFGDPLGLKPCSRFGRCGPPRRGARGGGGGGGNPHSADPEPRSGCREGVPTPSAGQDPLGLGGLAGSYAAFEDHLDPWLVGGAAIVSGGVVAVVGATASAGLVAALPDTFGISALLLPATGLVTGGGVALTAWGADIYINQVNNLVGTHIPGPGDVVPFPRFPSCR